MADQALLQRQWNARAAIAGRKEAGSQGLLVPADPHSPACIEKAPFFFPSSPSPSLLRRASLVGVSHLQSGPVIQLPRRVGRRLSAPQASARNAARGGQGEGHEHQRSARKVTTSDETQSGTSEAESSRSSGLPEEDVAPTASSENSRTSDLASAKGQGGGLLFQLARLEGLGWLWKQWKVPWSTITALAIFFGSQLLAAALGQLSGTLVHRYLGSEMVSSELQRFLSRTVAYLTVALVLETFLASRKKLEENPFEMTSKDGGWAQLKWVALWLVFRALWGGILSRGVALPGMCEPSTSFPIERLPPFLEDGLGLGVRELVVGGFDAASAAGIAKLAAPLNSVLDFAVAPWFEEALFRGFFQTSISAHFSPPVAVILTAVIQGGLFVQKHVRCGLRPTMFHPPPLIWHWFCDSTVAAVVYGLVYQRTRSLLPVVLLHQLETLSKMIVLSYTRGPKLGVAVRLVLKASTGGQ